MAARMTVNQGILLKAANQVIENLEAQNHQEDIWIEFDFWTGEELHRELQRTIDRNDYLKMMELTNFYHQHIYSNTTHGK